MAWPRKQNKIKNKSELINITRFLKLNPNLSNNFPHAKIKKLSYTVNLTNSCLMGTIDYCFRIL